MGRSKKTPFAPWESMKDNGDEARYIRAGNSQLLHPQTLNLNHAAFRVYHYMRLESAGKRVFKFPKSKYIKFISADGFNKAKQELIEAGFVDEVENNANLRKANVYQFSERWKVMQ